MCVSLDARQMSQPLGRGENQAVFSLRKGKVKLNVWVEEEGKVYVPRASEDNISDITVRPIIK
jgi:hypothetical protein